MTEKETLRKKYIETLQSIQNKKQREVTFVSKILDNSKVIGAKYILSFVSLSDEVSTVNLNYELSKIKEVFITEKQNFLVKDYKTGIQFENLDLIQIALVPGLAFTKDGKRLGRGGGWYDRFFKKYSNIYKIGVCFKEQILEEVPIESHDVIMNEILEV